jgi:hypothetical protein
LLEKKISSLPSTTNKTKLQPTNQSINHNVSFSLLLGQTLAHLPSITRSKFPPLPSQTTTLAATANCSSKSRSAKNKRNRHKELRPQNPQPPSFYSCAIKLPKNPTLQKKKKTPKSFRPQTPPQERRQKKVPKARELRVKKKKKKNKAFPMQSKSNEKRDLQ